MSAGTVSLAVLALAAGMFVPGPETTRTVCRNGQGDHLGQFYTFFRDTGSGCMTLGRGGRYRTNWALGTGGNQVVGVGWATGSPARVVDYRAEAFDPGRNGYLTLYGWSVDPLVEYYVVDNWGDFTPPGPDAKPLGTVQSDGGTYRIYRTTRVQQPSIQGTRTFDQFWSVRTEKRPIGGRNRITFANHVRAWQAAGMRLGTMNYQVLATEGFGSNGASNVRVREGR